MDIIWQIVTGYILLYLCECLLRLAPFFTSLKGFYRSMLTISCGNILMEIFGFYSAETEGTLEPKILALVVILTFYQFRVAKKFRRMRVARGVCGWCFTPIDTMLYTCPNCQNDYDE